MTSGATLVAFDFDGTLAPIHEDPARARMDASAAALLAKLVCLEGITVAVVSGRDADDLTMRVNTPGAYLVGSHGLEVRAPGGLPVRETPAAPQTLPPELHEEIVASGMRIEEKKYGVALHWRGVPFDAISPVVQSFRSWAFSRHLTLIEGRAVVEARHPGQGKEEALRWLTRVTGARRVLYAGDDLTDFGALRFAAENGTAIFVASSEREAPDGVQVVRSQSELVRAVRKEVLL